MSGLSVLKVLATVVDLFKMFNSTIGTFHHTEADALQRSSLAGLVAEYCCQQVLIRFFPILGLDSTESRYQKRFHFFF